MSIFGEMTGVNPFGSSLIDVRKKTNFGAKLKNITALSLVRGSIVTPAYDETNPATNGIDQTKPFAADYGGVFNAVKVPADLWDAAAGYGRAYSPFYVCTADADDTVVDNAIGTFWSGGPDGSLAQVLLYRDWTQALAEGELLAAIEAQTYLVHTVGVGGLTDTHSRPIAMTLRTYAANEIATTTSAQLIDVLWRGGRGI